MKIALYGATGNIGKRILAEALRRGHKVTAIVRDPARLAETDPNLTVVVGDTSDPSKVAEAISGSEVVIGSISGRRDGDLGVIVSSAKALIAAAQELGGVRVFWVGGAASLDISPGVKLFDSPHFPDIYRAEATAGMGALAAFRAADPSVDWTYLSPSAEIVPGDRTGDFRLGGDSLLSDASGKSWISMEDYAVALLDEVEKPQHTRQRFTVGY